MSKRLENYDFYAILYPQIGNISSPRPGKTQKSVPRAMDRRHSFDVGVIVSTKFYASQNLWYVVFHNQLRTRSRSRIPAVQLQIVRNRIIVVIQLEA